MQSLAAETIIFWSFIYSQLFYALFNNYDNSPPPLHFSNIDDEELKEENIEETETNICNHSSQQYHESRNALSSPCLFVIVSSLPSVKFAM